MSQLPHMARAQKVHSNQYKTFKNFNSSIYHQWAAPLTDYIVKVGYGWAKFANIVNIDEYELLPVSATDASCLHGNGEIFTKFNLFI